MTKMRRGIVGDRRGSSTAIVVFALAFMGLLAVAGLETAVNEHRSATATANSADALYAAEAGLNRVLGDWPDAQFVDVVPGDSLDMGWTTLPNGARYRAVIRRYDEGVVQQMRAIKVESQGVGPLGGRGVLWVWTTVPILHKAAVNAGGLVRFRGGAVSDAYDSRDGDYGVGPITQDGDIMTNGSVDLQGNKSGVGGDAIVSGTVNKPGQVTGSVTEGAPPQEYPAMPCPSSYTPITDMPVTPGVVYDALTGALVITSTTLTLPSGEYNFSSITMSGGATLDVAADSDVEIFVSGAIDISGNSHINNSTRDASNLTFYGCGTGTSTWNMSSGNNGYFSVYAPTREVILSGGNEVFGALTVGSLDNAGGSDIHFDKALLAGNHRGEIVSRSWTQLAR